MIYDFLAGWFETLNDDCDYPRWSQYFIEGLSSLGAGRRGLELGCGSGVFCRALQRSGYSMTGADISAPMLSEAARRAKEEGLSIPFVMADAARLHAPSPFDFILAPNDVFNYLPPEKLPAAFGHVRKSLVRGGIFWFDVSSEYKLRVKIANTVSADDRDDVTYLAFNTLFPDRLETEVTLFTRETRQKELFRRHDETHVRFIHAEETLLKALENTGLEVIGTEGAFGEQKENSDRLNVICRAV